MARPREFDEDEVLDKAMHVFWEHGFESTSVSELERATGLVRTSLYGAFGDKEKLFLRVLDRFNRRYDTFARAMSTGEPARAGFEEAFRIWLDLNCQSEGPRGCLVQLASTTGADALPKARSLLEESMKATQRGVQKALARAHDRGELPPGADVKVLTRYLLVGMQGLSSAARGGSTRRELEPVIALMLDAIFGPAAEGAKPKA